MRTDGWINGRLYVRLATALSMVHLNFGKNLSPRNLIYSVDFDFVLAPDEAPPNALKGKTIQNRPALWKVFKGKLLLKQIL